MKLRYLIALLLAMVSVCTACDSVQDVPEEEVFYETDEYYVEEYAYNNEMDEDELEEYVWEYQWNNYETDDWLDEWAGRMGMTPGAVVSEYGYATDMELICEELESQGYSHEFEALFRIADEIGYCPSAILGKYCIDKETQTLHLTDCEECVKSIPYENMSFAFGYRELEKNYSGNCCEMCFES